MKSTGLKNRAWQLAAMLVVLIAGLSFASCASDDGEDKEASPINRYMDGTSQQHRHLLHAV